MVIIDKDKTKWTHYVNELRAVNREGSTRYCLEDGSEYDSKNNMWSHFYTEKDGSRTYELQMDFNPTIKEIDENS